MFLKLFIALFAILQKQEIHSTSEELARLKKMDNLASLVTLLSIFSLTILILLTINLIKNYKLKAEINKLKKL